jgi:DNA topoisomerase-3
MKKLVIAEKPSVARDIVSVLGEFKKQDEFYENNDYVVSSAVGHLVELFMPEDIDTGLKKWDLNTLPILPEKFEKNR